ncbi:MAG: indolepyruvate ferredoxin oxidoreductase family protein [Dinoroseobacter sp.]|nr:indolepyruvate ferredoxin oxidoreductase family protein [Dinoroseobacter sp.]
MSRQDVRLSDRFDLTKSPVLLNGTQALVRLMLIQSARDNQAGLNTAGYVTGYRGSPLGAVDMQMNRAKPELDAARVTFHEGLNEDLAATALWGAQQAHLRGEGAYDGVFGLWYGKGPGVDRSGDAMKHANMAGTAPNGGVLMAMGDDHTGESSTVLHQSEWAMVDAYMPILNPAGVQEIIDYGVLGYALSRFAGVWVGLKTVKETVEATAIVDGDPNRVKLITPDFAGPEGGLNIRLIDTPHAQEARMIDYKRFAAERFGHANKIDKRVWGKPGAKIGLISTGKSWLDLQQALSILGIDANEAERLGITTYKVGMSWPLDTRGFEDWAEGLDLLICVEEKRKLLEVQAKDVIFHNRKGRRVYGWKNDRGEELFPTRDQLDPVWIAEKLAGIFIEEGRNTEAIKAGLARVQASRRADNAPALAQRTPYFCSGCPHNTSTKIPEGARGSAGIGCHYMVQWMDRETLGFTHMGGEGANWIGESQFSTREHIFQNIGDGTYNHSGVQAIRAALAANTNITYKILFNDAVAMTGGQKNDGGLSAEQITHELKAMGVKNIALIYDEKEVSDFSGFPSDVERHERAQLMQVQDRFQTLKGVSALVYVQTCASEKRRRRKRGAFPDPDKRVFINTDICEGCGDCGVQSNCVSIVPVETELGRKRAIDQSSCNKDFSCVQGFCPSFVTIAGAKLRNAATTNLELPELPDPLLPGIQGAHNIVITGVGGTGVVTLGATLAMAAHLDEKGAAMIEMAGLAQKGGAVHIHCRIAETQDDISAIRVSVGEADAVIGGDLVVSAQAKTLGLMTKGKTGAVVNSHEIVTGEFTRDTEFTIPGADLREALSNRLGQDRLATFDATKLAQKLLGDSIYSNMMIMGGAWQRGLIPLSHGAIMRAIELNGAAPKANQRAFEIGRWAALYPDQAETLLAAEVVARPKSLAEKIAFRADHLVAYQSASLARRFRKLVDPIEDDDVKEAVALGYHKLLSYKDEYEVARLLSDTLKKAEETFEGDLKLTYLLAPPLFARKGPNGRPKKIGFGQAMARTFPVLARFKRIRGTILDPFGYTAERKMERALIREYEENVTEALSKLMPDTKEAVVALAKLPLQIRGFGPVKAAHADAASLRRAELLSVIRSGGAPLASAAE